MLTRGYWPIMFTRGYWPGNVIGLVVPSTYTSYEAYRALVSADPYLATIASDYKARVDVSKE